MGNVRGNDDERPSGNIIASDVIVGNRRPEETPGRGIEPHDLLQHHVAVASAGENRRIAGCGRRGHRRSHDRARSPGTSGCFASSQDVPSTILIRHGLESRVQHGHDLVAKTLVAAGLAFAVEHQTGQQILGWRRGASPGVRRSSP